MSGLSARTAVRVAATVAAALLGAATPSAVSAAPAGAGAAQPGAGVAASGAGAVQPGAGAATPVGAARPAQVAVPSGAAAETGGVTCQYIVTAAWTGGFTADLNIINDGPPIKGWTVRWTAPVPTSDVRGWAAWMTQQGAEIVARDMGWNANVPTGESRAFGWSATAPSAEVPTSITINGTAC